MCFYIYVKLIWTLTSFINTLQTSSYISYNDTVSQYKDNNRVLLLCCISTFTEGSDYFLQLCGFGLCSHTRCVRSPGRKAAAVGRKASDGVCSAAEAWGLAWSYPPPSASRRYSAVCRLPKAPPYRAAHRAPTTQLRSHALIVDPESAASDSDQIHSGGEMSHIICVS